MVRGSLQPIFRILTGVISSPITTLCSYMPQTHIKVLFWSSTYQSSWPVGSTTQDGLLIADAHQMADAQDQHGDDRGRNAGQCDMEQLLEPARAVDGCGVVQLRVHAGECRQ